MAFLFVSLNYTNGVIKKFAFLFYYESSGLAFISLM